MIGIAMGINSLLEIFNEKYYENLEGGILEAFGRLFRNAVKFYVYPMSQDAYARYRLDAGENSPLQHTLACNVLITTKNVRLADHLGNLYAHLVENRYIDCITGFDVAILNIFSRDVLKMIGEGDAHWETLVPAPVCKSVKDKRLFGYLAQETRSSGATPPSGARATGNPAS